MSEPTPELTPNDEAAEASESTEAAPPRHVPVAEHAEERKRRQAAEAQAAALQKQLDDIAAANLSDLERAQRAAADAQAAADRATAEALRLRIAAKHGISDEDADLFLTGSDMETVERQATALAARTAPGGQPGPRADLSQGTKGAPATGDPVTDFTNLINSLPG